MDTLRAIPKQKVLKTTLSPLDATDISSIHVSCFLKGQYLNLDSN